MPFASRAGEKLDHALTVSGISVEGKVCADLGASTGGFVDCLLQRGATKVYAVEKGYGTVDWKLRNDPRVVVKERTNALQVQLPELMDVISIDCGWTKQSFIVPHALTLLKPGGIIVSLVKPHYEARRDELVKGKVPDELGPQIVDRVVADLESRGMTITQRIESPLVGSKGGNHEYFVVIRK